jgi:hypothetical protein
LLQKGPASSQQLAALAAVAFYHITKLTFFRFCGFIKNERYLIKRHGKQKKRKNRNISKFSFKKLKKKKTWMIFEQGKNAVQPGCVCVCFMVPCQGSLC